MNELEQKQYKDSSRKIYKRALEKGLIIRKNCEVCNAKSDYNHGHHEDYSKPLDIKWVCPRHHQMIHYRIPRRLKKWTSKIRWMLEFETYEIREFNRISWEEYKEKEDKRRKKFREGAHKPITGKGIRII